MHRSLTTILLAISFSVPGSAIAADGAFIYGDDSCISLKEKLHRDFPASVDPASCGKELSQPTPKLVLLAVNALLGISQENKSDLARLKAKGVTQFGIVLVNTNLVDDAELLELETLELIESMNAIGLPGDDIVIMLDYDAAPYDPNIGIRKGPDKIAEYVNIMLK